MLQFWILLIVLVIAAPLLARAYAMRPGAVRRWRRNAPVMETVSEESNSESKSDFSLDKFLSNLSQIYAAQEKHVQYYEGEAKP